ncbi:hypothetical protein [Bradyrhizobium sp. STM 3562]|uniref:hypothetical protein n=1 Tax=Bradyrhizobium sp. STM 3562 TaxID=578924 RepID=UPI00388E46FF
MRFPAALIALCAFSQVAQAATQDCKTITDPALRLTCYDKINPPIATYPIPLPKPSRPISSSSPDATGYADPQNDDEAQVRAQLRNICRGC